MHDILGQRSQEPIDRFSRFPGARYERQRDRPRPFLARRHSAKMEWLAIGLWVDLWVNNLTKHIPLI
jgi:hypothetical protein